MTFRIPTLMGANLLLAIGLYDIQLAILSKGSVDEVIEPSLGHFPVLFAREPSWRARSVVPEPTAIISGIWQPYAELLTFTGPTKDHRNIPLLPPDIINCQLVHVDRPCGLALHL